MDRAEDAPRDEEGNLTDEGKALVQAALDYGKHLRSDALQLALRLSTLAAVARDVARQLAEGPVSWAERHEMAVRLTEAAGG
jgi:hypothetical protein